MAIERIDNGDGTTTFRGVDVTIPTSLAATHDVAEVRRAMPGDLIAASGQAREAETALQLIYVILAPRPTWKPPASLMPGEYEWRGEYLTDSGFSAAWASKHLRDWTDPPKLGKWRVNEDGTSTYLGE